MARSSLAGANKERMENRARGQDRLVLEGRNHTIAVWKRSGAVACGADSSGVDSSANGVDLDTRGGYGRPGTKAGAEHRTQTRHNLDTGQGGSEGASARVIQLLSRWHVHD